MTEAVDLVYCWCNGADPVFRAERARYGRPDTPGNESCRFADSGELRFSLRSAALNAPWFRRVWILVNDGSAVPGWLSADRRVTVVRIGEILPADSLPCFNSATIEFWMWRIPGLAERFVYGNDDMFFCRPVQPRHFFTADGRVICRYSADALNERGWSIYGDTLILSREFMRRQESSETLAPEWRKAERLHPHHCFDGYLKSSMAEFCERFPDELEVAARARFRVRTQLQRDVFSLWAMATGRGVFRSVRRSRLARLLGRPRWESLVYELNVPWATDVIVRQRPYFFCLNDSERSTDAQRAAARDWLEGRFP